ANAMQVVQLSFACPLRNQWHFAEASVSEAPATESRSTRHRFEKKSWSSNRFPSGKSRRRVVSPRTKTTSHGRASNSDREQQRLCAWKDRQPPPRQRKAVPRHKRSASQISHPATGSLQLHGREEKQPDNRCLTMPRSSRRASPSASINSPTVKLVGLIVASLGTYCLAASLHGHEVVSCPSPDGKFAMRCVYAEAQPYAGEAAVVDLSTHKDVVALDPNWTLGHARLFWSADSQRVAYFSQKGNGYSTRIFFRNGDALNEIPLPELPTPKLPQNATGSEADTQTRVEPLAWHSP